MDDWIPLPLDKPVMQVLAAAAALAANEAVARPDAPPADAATAVAFEPAATEMFLSQFAPVFALNARYSQVKPVPALGAADAPWSQVRHATNQFCNCKYISMI